MLDRLAPSKTLLTSLIATIVLSVGCGGEDNHPKILIGAVIDQTGNNSELSWIQAVQLAMVQMNDALAAEGDFKNFRFDLNLQNSENDVVGGYDSRAMVRLRAIAESGAVASILDTTQVSEEANKPSNNLGIPLQCSSCTGGSFLNATTTVATDPELQAARRNADHWMQRTIMSTGSLAVVVAQMIYGMPNHGDLNNDGKIKLATYGSDESFGQSTTLAAITELKKKFTGPDLLKLRFERKLHVNSNDLREIPFAADMARLNNTTNEDMPPADATAASINGHLFGQPEANDTSDGAPDLIAVATFARNGVAFVTEFKNEGLDKSTSTQIIHFHTFRFSSNLLALGSQAEGQYGASHVITDGESGDQFSAAFQREFGLLPVYRDSIYYDNAVTMMLATIIALQTRDLTRDTLTGADVRDVFPCTSTNAARLITTRPDLVCPGDPGTPATEITPSVEGFRTAIRELVAGNAIDYRGASGPIDYDALGNVKGKVASYKVINGRYEDTAQFDCIASAACSCTSGECPSQQ